MGLFGETDSEFAKRRFKEEVAAHEKRMEEFEKEARKAGFSFAQIEFMAKYVALSHHSHQYYNSLHYHLTTPPVDGRSEDREY